MGKRKTPPEELGKIFERDDRIRENARVNGGHLVVWASKHLRNQPYVQNMLLNVRVLELVAEYWCSRHPDPELLPIDFVRAQVWCKMAKIQHGQIRLVSLGAGKSKNKHIFIGFDLPSLSHIKSLKGQSIPPYNAVSWQRTERKRWCMGYPQAIPTWVSQVEGSWPT